MPMRGMTSSCWDRLGLCSTSCAMGTAPPALPVPGEYTPGSPNASRVERRRRRDRPASSPCSRDSISDLRYGLPVPGRVEAAGDRLVGQPHLAVGCVRIGGGVRSGSAVVAPPASLGVVGAAEVVVEAARLVDHDHPGLGA